MTDENPGKPVKPTQPQVPAATDEMSEHEAAEFVDALASRAPTTEQSARENTGGTRHPDDGHPDPYLGVSDTEHGLPEDERDRRRRPDASHRGRHEIQGEEIRTTGNHSERRPEDTHL